MKRQSYKDCGSSVRTETKRTNQTAMVVLTFHGLVLSDYGGRNVRVERKWIAGRSIVKIPNPVKSNFLGEIV